MAKDELSGKLAVILHADVAGSTQLVQQDEQLAHERIQEAFRLFSDTIGRYNGRVQELRGDALLAEFGRASDAVTAALSFQSDHSDHLVEFNDDIRPEIRVGIALGEVVIADRTVTGAGVVLAQRVEQLAQPGELCITSAIHEALPNRLPFFFESLGEQGLKGFEDPVRVYRVQLDRDEAVPPPQQKIRQPVTPPNRLLRILVGVVLLVVAGIGFWLKSSLPQEEPASIERMAFPLPEKPSIVVLPFSNLNGDSSQDYFADGMTEDLITDLSKVPGLFVIARNSAFAYKNRQVKIQQVAEDLGIRYVLEGSVRLAGEQVRINAQLIDAISGGHLWAERYDGSINDVFRLQDQVAAEIVRAAAVKLDAGLDIDGTGLGTSNPDSHEAYLQGLALYVRNSPLDNAKAEQLFKSAIQLDSGFGRAHAALANTYFRCTEVVYARSMGISTRKATYFAYQALANWSGMTDAVKYAAQARASLLRGQHASAIRDAEFALSLVPSNIDVLKTMALAAIYSAQLQKGRDLINNIIRLDPASNAEPMYLHGLASFADGRYDEAANYIEQAISADPANAVYMRLLAALYGLLDRIEDAKAAMKTYRKSHRGQYWIAAAVMQYPFEDIRLLEALANGFEKAGLVERPPSRFLELVPQSRLSSSEIETLITGNTLKGTDYWRGNGWHLYRSPEGILRQEGGTVFYSIGPDGLRNLPMESWLDGDRLCHQGVAVNEKIDFCISVYRDTVRGTGNYYLVSDSGPHPFTVLEGFGLEGTWDE